MSMDYLHPTFSDPSVSLVTDASTPVIEEVTWFRSWPEYASYCTQTYYTYLLVITLLVTFMPNLCFFNINSLQMTLPWQNTRLSYATC